MWIQESFSQYRIAFGREIQSVLKVVEAFCISLAKKKKFPQISLDIFNKMVQENPIQDKHSKTSINGKFHILFWEDQMFHSSLGLQLLLINLHFETRGLFNMKRGCRVGVFLKNF